MSIKVIFLDVDGVLNSQASTSKCRFYIGIDDDKVKRLNTIVNATGAKIVLVSSWKSHWHKIDKESQDEYGNYLDRKLNRERLHIFDKTQIEDYDGSACPHRGEGILSWIGKLPEGSVENFIILDDEVFDYSSCNLLPHLVQTAFYSDIGGLTDEHVEIAIRLLNDGCGDKQQVCSGFVLCTECACAEDCDAREYQAGCYFGEKNKLKN